MDWVTGVDQAFEQGGLKLENNKIHIPANGLYFVYSQVSYAIQCNSDDDNFLSHVILRYTDAVGKDMPLQSSAHSVCQSHEGESTTYSTVYLGAVFQLNEGDRLSTVTTRVADVEEDYAKTFFGVFALWFISHMSQVALVQRQVFYVKTLMYGLRAFALFVVWLMMKVLIASWKCFGSKKCIRCSESHALNTMYSVMSTIARALHLVYLF